MDTTIEYKHKDLRALKVQMGEVNGRQRPIAVSVDGEEFTPTKRFWKSLFMRFGINDAVFRYFTFDEVLDRIVVKDPECKLRFCIGHNPGTRSKLYGVSNPTRPLLYFNEAIQLLSRHGGQNLRLAEGLLQADHIPRSGERSFQIGGDAFNNRVMAELPIDGFGDPRFFLSLLRQVCTNGAVGYTRAFRSDIKLGEDGPHTLERALSQFDNDEGFSAMRQRFESAQTSRASVRECLRLQMALRGAMPGQAGAMTSKLEGITGDLRYMYGLANLESLSAKKQRILPAHGTVYDLINFASEVATHKATPIQGGKIQAWLGQTISEEYDLEGTLRPGTEFQDLFLTPN